MFTLFTSSYWETNLLEIRIRSFRYCSFLKVAKLSSSQKASFKKSVMMCVRTKYFSFSFIYFS